MPKLTTPMERKFFLQARVTRVLVEAVCTVNVIKHRVGHLCKIVLKFQFFD